MLFVKLMSKMAESELVEQQFHEIADRIDTRIHTEVDPLFAKIVFPSMIPL